MLRFLLGWLAPRRKAVFGWADLTEAQKDKWLDRMAKKQGWSKTEKARMKADLNAASRKRAGNRRR